MPEYVFILIRSLLSFVTLLILTRLMGKKQISQLTLFDYIVGISIGNIAATMAIEQSVKILNALIGLLIWGLLPIILSIIGIKSHRFRKLVDGQPIILIQDGKVLEKNLRKAKMNTSDMVLQLREKNAFNLADVEFAVLETNGQLSVMKKPDSQPLTPKSFGIQVQAERDPHMVILDGKIMEKTLKKLGLTKQWLIEELNKRGIHRAQDVFIAQVDSQGNLYTDLHRDDLDQTLNLNTQLSTLSASLKGIQSNLERLALQIQAQSMQKSVDHLQSDDSNNP